MSRNLVALFPLLLALNPPVWAQNPAAPLPQITPAYPDEPVRRIGEGVKPPTLAFAPDPEFSEEARKKKMGGIVLVGLQIDKEGNPIKVHVVRGVGMGLDEKAVEAVSRYRFHPATENGQPVVVQLTIQVNFVIKDHA